MAPKYSYGSSPLGLEHKCGPKNIEHNWRKVLCLQICEVEELVTDIFLKISKFGQIYIKLLEA